MNFDAKRGLYIGVDENKKEWIEAIQQTQVPIFWSYCPNEIEKNGIPVICNVPNMTPIFEDGIEKICTGCKKKFKVEIKVSKDNTCYYLLEKIRKEGE